MHAAAKAVVMTALLLPMVGKPGCELDQAQVTAVPPNTFQVLATYRCGNVTCWKRWIENDGKTAGESTGGELDKPKGD